MLGETVAVLTRRSVGTDEMGDPIYDWDAENVPNVLVRPLQSQELNDALRPDGVRVIYALAFPKTFAGNLNHARVALITRGMDASKPDDALRVTGNTDKTPQSPLLWDRTVEVGRVDG